MVQSCIIRSNTGLHCIYCENNNLYIRSLKATNWGGQTLIAGNVHSGHTVSYSDENNLCVIYRQSDGSICLACEKNNWKPRVILKSKGEFGTEITMHLIQKNNRMLLLYNLPQNGENKIGMQYLQGDKIWSEPVVIDGFSPLQGENFRIINTENGNILFYMKRMPEERLGFRTITEEKIGSYFGLYATGYTITDYSLLCHKDTIHICIIVSTNFGKQLIYTSHGKNGNTPPIVLCDFRGINNCCISFIKDKLYVWWINSKRLYYRISYDYGASFTQVQRYGKFADTAVKAHFISEVQTEDFACSDVYVKSNMPWDVQLMEDFYVDFFCCDNQTESEKIKSEISEMQQKIRDYQTEITEKDEMIYKLNKMLNMKNNSGFSI
jgi:hypothetical protein